MSDATTPVASLRGYPYATIPEWILLEASGQAVRLFAVLDRYVGSNDSAWPYRSTLANRLKCSVKTVDRALEELISMGALAVEHRKRADGSWTSSEYILWPRNCLQVATKLSLPIPTDGATLDPPVTQQEEVTTVKEPQLEKEGDSSISESDDLNVQVATDLEEGRRRREELEQLRLQREEIASRRKAS
jgi:DNA-binding transcriptional MocR family regulator